jgi:type IV pilus assembly protein PilC
MKTFVYIYKTPDSRILTKKVKANNLDEATSHLKKRNITPISIKAEGYNIWYELTKPTTVTSDEVVAFSQLFSGCIRSGLKIKESLTLLSKQLKNKLLTEKLAEIIISLEGGASLSDAFNKHIDIFPKFYPMVIKAGEASGNLADVLDYISGFLETTNNIKKQVQGIITYPLIVTIMGAGLLGLILIFVAPTFKEVFSSAEKALPLPTQILFGLSDFILFNYHIILGTIFGIIAIIYGVYRSPKGKRLFHILELHFPISGAITKQIILLRFLGCFDILINNDVPMTQALVVLEDAITNIRVKEIITEMRKDVARGLPLSGPLVENKTIISPMISYTIAMGEKAGNLGLSVNRITNFVKKELEFSMKKLSSRIEPIITLFLGSVVLFIAVSIYLPIFDLMAQ